MKIFNSMNRRKEDFVPLREGKVGIYACGPTVYNYFHIGNARMFIVFDVLRRYFEYKGYEVTYVQNFTDIDDKMIARANQEGITVRELADRFVKEYYKDAQALGIHPATVHPYATEHIPQIIRLVETLILKGLAYEVNGDIYYDTAAFPDYGKLSGQKMDDLDAGARVGVDEDKKNPADFALWKKQKPGEPGWDSPWGMGRPGWHIECSAMSMEYLGETFDIHCGGQDLLFPHHENEIAQSEGATGHPFARYWMHNGFLNVDNQKMSKSLGNFFTVRDITREFDAEDIRMFMLSAQYRSPLNFSREQMQQAHASLQRLYGARDKILFLMEDLEDRALWDEENAVKSRVDDCVAAFEAAMDDDLNTAEAMGALFDLVYLINTEISEKSAQSLAQYALTQLHKICEVPGLLLKKPDELPGDVAELVEKRAQARSDKNWQGSDALRDAIAALGYLVEDTPKGQKVRRLT